MEKVQFSSSPSSRSLQEKPLVSNLTFPDSTPEPTEEPNAPVHGVPGNPTEVAAVAYDGRAQVSWEAPDDNGEDPILQYEVATFLQDSAEPRDGAVIIASADTKTVPQTFTIVGNLQNGKSYSFRVRASNVNGLSTWSARSQMISPLHPSDLCTHVTCAGHGTCFPNYAADETGDNNARAVCICHASYTSVDCSLEDGPGFGYVSTPWKKCSNGCGGGQRLREVVCTDMKTNLPALDPVSCSHLKKPNSMQMCNNVACGLNLVDVHYELEMNYEDVLFNGECMDRFIEAFTTELSSAVVIAPHRVEVTALSKGSIIVHFRILPASAEEEKSLDEVMESFQTQLTDTESDLRTKGTFARRVNPDTVKFSFFIAEQAEAGQAEDISVAGLLGTVMVLVAFISTFAWYLRRRHAKMMLNDPSHRFEAVLSSENEDVKPNVHMQVRSATE